MQRGFSPAHTIRWGRVLNFASNRFARAALISERSQAPPVVARPPFPSSRDASTAACLCRLLTTSTGAAQQLTLPTSPAWPVTAYAPRLLTLRSHPGAPSLAPVLACAAYPPSDGAYWASYSAPAYRPRGIHASRALMHSGSAPFRAALAVFCWSWRRLFVVPLARAEGHPRYAPWQQSLTSRGSARALCSRNPALR